MKNIAEILRACFKANEPIYSPVCGEVTDWYVKANGDIVMTKCDMTYTFDEYGRMDVGECLVFPSKDKRCWEEFEYNHQFKPFDRVVVRDRTLWHVDFFDMLITKDGEAYKYRCVGGTWQNCLPYNEMTAKLIGTTDELSGC